MVSHSRQLCYLILLVMLCHVAHAGDFSMRLDKTRVELGKSVHLILQSTNLSTSLHSLDLSPLDKDFFVDSSADISIVNQQQSWKIKLYPRRGGHLELPILSNGDQHTSRLSLNVTPPIDSVTGRTLNFSTAISTTTAWVNQQVVITLTLHSRNRYEVLQTSDSSLSTGRLIQIPQQTSLPDKRGYYRHTIGWAFFPAQTGDLLLRLPPIEYKHDGIITHRFYLPTQKLYVKPLPVYVPTNFAIGKLTLQVQPSTRFLLANKLHMVNLELTASGISKNQLPRLEAYLQSSSGLQLFPAITKLKQTSSETGLTSKIQIQLPVRARHSGFYRLDNIEIQYFDPRSGKLKTLSYRWPLYFFISPVLLFFSVVLGLALLVFILQRLFRYVSQFWQRQRHWLRAKQLLAVAKTPEDIRAAIRFMMLAQTGGHNMTLLEWSNKHQLDIKPLSDALYGNEKFTINMLKQPYLQFCQHRYWFSF